MIHAMIVHPVTLISDLLTTMLESQGPIKVIGRASTPNEALAILTATPCNVALVNCLLPGVDVLTLIRAIAKHFGDVKIIMIGLVESRTTIVHYLEAGATGYVLDSDGADHLMSVVRQAAAGDALISPSVAAALIARVKQLRWLAIEQNGYDEADMKRGVTGLTEQERKVLALLGQGDRNCDIAEKLFITVGTVKNHVHNILEKLDVHTRKQAAMVACQLALGETNADEGAIVTWPKVLEFDMTSRRATVMR